MAVIDLATTKSLLGIAGSTYDSQITALLPRMDSIVKQVTNNRFNYQIIGKTVSGLPYVEIYSIKFLTGQIWEYKKTNNFDFFDDIESYVETGMQVSGEGIPSGAYIEEVYYNGDVVTLGGTDYFVPAIKLSANSTATSTDSQIFLNIHLAYQPIIAKGIWYLIQQTSTTLPSKTVTSQSMGSVSVSYSGTDDRIDGRYGMPGWFVKGLPYYGSGI